MISIIVKSVFWSCMTKTYAFKNPQNWELLDISPNPKYWQNFCLNKVHRLQISRIIKMSACITPIFLHITGRVTQGGDIASPGQPFLCIHIPCTVQQLPALCHQCHLEPSCPSQAPAQVLTGVRRWQTCRPALHQLLPYTPQALRIALLEKHLVQHTDPSEKSRCRRASGTLRPWLEQALCTPQHHLAVNVLASALPLKLERVYRGDGVSLTSVSLFPTQIHRYEE